MEMNENINAEVIENAAEEILNTDVIKNYKVVKMVGIAGIVGVAGFVAYKYAIKPGVAKIKERKASKDKTEYCEEVCCECGDSIIEE